MITALILAWSISSSSIGKVMDYPSWLQATAATHQNITTSITNGAPLTTNGAARAVYSALDGYLERMAVFGSDRVATNNVDLQSVSTEDFTPYDTPLSRRLRDWEGNPMVRINSNAVRQINNFDPSVYRSALLPSAIGIPTINSRGGEEVASVFVVKEELGQLHGVYASCDDFLNGGKYDRLNSAIIKMNDNFGITNRIKTITQSAWTQAQRVGLPWNNYAQYASAMFGGGSAFASDYAAIDSSAWSDGRKKLPLVGGKLEPLQLAQEPSFTLTQEEVANYKEYSDQGVYECAYEDGYLAVVDFPTSISEGIDGGAVTNTATTNMSYLVAYCNGPEAERTVTISPTVTYHATNIMVNTEVPLYTGDFYLVGEIGMGSTASVIGDQGWITGCWAENSGGQYINQDGEVSQYKWMCGGISLQFKNPSAVISTFVKARRAAFFQYPSRLYVHGQGPVYDKAVFAEEFLERFVYGQDRRIVRTRSAYDQPWSVADTTNLFVHTSSVAASGVQQIETQLHNAIDSDLWSFIQLYDQSASQITYNLTVTDDEIKSIYSAYYAGLAEHGMKFAPLTGPIYTKYRIHVNSEGKAIGPLEAYSEGEWIEPYDTFMGNLGPSGWEGGADAMENVRQVQWINQQDEFKSVMHMDYYLREKFDWHNYKLAQ